MRTERNTFLKSFLNGFVTRLGVSISLTVLLSSISSAQTWYDSEGRLVVFKGKKVIRKVIEADESDKEAEVVNSIIPKSLELRAELSTYRGRRSYPVYYSYPRYHYGYSGRSYFPRYRDYPYCHQGSFRSSGGYSRNIHLNYRRGGLSIRARF